MTMCEPIGHRVDAESKKRSGLVLIFGWALQGFCDFGGWRF